MSKQGRQTIDVGEVEKQPRRYDVGNVKIHVRRCDVVYVRHRECSACYNVDKKYLQEKTTRYVIAPHDVVQFRHESPVHFTTKMRGTYRKEQIETLLPPPTTTKRQQLGRHVCVQTQDEVWANPRLPNILTRTCFGVYINYIVLHAD